MRISDLTLLERDGYSSFRIAPALLGYPMDPFLSIDIFKQEKPIFPARPLAGYSAVTYLFLEGSGKLLSRDSLGGSYTASAGDLLWTRAARGIIQEERPTEGTVWGAHVHFNLSRATELSEPAVFFHPAPEAIQLGGGKLHLLSGSWLEEERIIDPLSSFVLAEVTLSSEQLLPTKQGDNIFIFPLDGILRSPVGELGYGELLHHMSDGAPIPIGSEEATILLMMGSPLQDLVEPFGPFAMSDRLRNQVVAQQYRSGGLGRLK